MSFTGAATRIGTTGGFGRSESRPQGVTGIGSDRFIVGRAQDRILRLTSDDASTSEWASTVLGGEPHSLAGHNGNLYVFVGRELKVVTPPFGPTRPLSDVFTIPDSHVPRALTSNTVNLFYLNQQGAFSILYRIDNLDGTPSVVELATSSVVMNVRGMVWLDGFFWFADNTSDALWRVPDSEVSGTQFTPVQVGDWTEFDAGITTPQGLGVADGVGLVVSLNNGGSIYELRDFSIDNPLSDQSWVVGTAVSTPALLTSHGTTPIEFSISPALPAGLSISSTNGSITGNPTTASEETEYTITAEDDNGIIDTFTFMASVITGGTPPPPDLMPSFGAATIDDISATENSAISAVTLPAATGGDTPLTYELSPALPAGMAFDAATRELSGTPTAVVAQTEYTYTVTDADGDTDTIQFNITVDVEPLVATTLEIISGNNQTATEGTALTDPLIVQVNDQNGDPLSGVEVSFAVSPNDGSLGTDTATTDANGRASTQLTLGNTVGTYTVTVSVAGIDDIEFTATATAVPIVLVATTLEIVDGNNQSAVVGNPLTDNLVVQVNDQNGNPFAGATVAFSVSPNDGRLSHTSRTTGSNGRASTALTLGQTVGTYTVTASVTGLDAVSLIATARAEIPPPKPPPRGRAVPRFTNAPMALKVELTPTTALVTWKAPTNGASIRGYEVSYAEGSTPGTIWIPTGSRSTRFLVENLKRGTQHTWQVRGFTDNGAGPASSPITEYTPIASPHNTLFFKDCVNYFDRGARVSVHGTPTELVRTVADNDYNTFTREKDLDINIAVNGQPTRVNAIAVMGVDIEGHSAEPTGGSGVGYSNRSMPATVKNWEGSEVSTVVAGFQHDLYLLSPHFTATNVRMTFTGANAKIYEVMLLEFGIEIDANADFTEIDPDYVDRTGVIHPSTGDGIYRGPPLANERDKWEVNLVVKVIPGKTLLQSVDEFLWWRSQNKNHVFALEPSRHPRRVHPASFLLRRVSVRLRTDNKNDGEVMNLRIGER